MGFLMTNGPAAPAIPPPPPTPPSLADASGSTAAARRAAAAAEGTGMGGTDLTGPSGAPKPAGKTKELLGQ